MTEEDHRLLEVPPDAAGERLDRFLALALPEISRSRLAVLVRDGRVLVDGQPAKVSARLKGGERIDCAFPDPADGGLVAEDGHLRVLYEDADILVLDKPAGLVVHPGAGTREGTLAHALLHHCGPALLAVGGTGRPGIVHRLDKGTTGVIAVAKTPAAYRSLTGQFAARTVEKTYLALVTGSPLPAGSVAAPIARSPTHRTRMAVVPGGRPALSEWRVLERFGQSVALVEIALHTGRTHQARVHMAHAGHGIAGDETYRGGGKPLDAWARGLVGRLERPALHAWKLALDHPVTGERLTLEAPLPPDMAELIEALRDRIGAPRPR